MPDIDTLRGIHWAVHVRGPDDVVPVANYEDAVRLTDQLNYWWGGLNLREHDPHISAIPVIFDGTPEQHAEYVAKLGTKAYDYAVPTDEQVENTRKKMLAARINAALANKTEGSEP